MNYIDKAGKEMSAAFIGSLEDCKYIIEVLTTAEMECGLDLADRAGAQFTARGYYMVSVAAAVGEQARAAIEQQLRTDLRLDAPEMAVPDQQEQCPACGTALLPGAAACPECGLNFE